MSCKLEHLKILPKIFNLGSFTKFNIFWQNLQMLELTWHISDSDYFFKLKHPRSGMGEISKGRHLIWYGAV